MPPSFAARFGHDFFGYGTPTPVTEDLQLRIKDDVFVLQASKPDFANIDAATLLQGDICTNQHNADKAIRASHKLGIIDATTGHGDTSRIDRSLVNSMASMSVRKQRLFVLLLFFMEEEVTRWRLLTAEEENVKAQLESEDSNRGHRAELELMLAKIRADKNVLPSKREASGRIHDVDEEEQLPQYTA